MKNIDTCPKCGATENFHYNYDYSKAHRPVFDILCNECEELFLPVLKLPKEEPKIMQLDLKETIANNMYIRNITNAVFIGINAGSEITEGDGIVIIGDNILNLDKSQPNVLFIGDKVAIGKTIFGTSINMMEVINEYLNKIKL